MRTHTVPGALLALALLAAGCSDERADPSIFGPEAPNRTFTQIERLGNPLVSEVLLEKRNHGFHNNGTPSTDVANFKGLVELFVRDVAGRNQTVQQTLSAVLLPDMLIVQTNQAASTAGWLSWALADGYGGRKPSDDVVDAGLAALFGTLLSPDNASPGLSSDNVAGNDKQFGTAFPYLAAPTQ